MLNFLSETRIYRYIFAKITVRNEKRSDQLSFILTETNLFFNAAILYYRIFVL